MNIVGSVAGVLTVAAFVPQTYKAVKTKKTRDLALATYATLIVTGTLWTIYGVQTKSPAVYITNVIIALLALIICVMKIIEG
ncbi:MAG TPA: SemiSWEET family transporter [Candidatus Dormibacteraeota bacterium]|nr:SemiSWEET family transporter [Candidatus Dormibacteraeota bacterium]